MTQGKITLSPLVFDDIGIQDAAKKVLVLAKNRQGGFVVTPNGVMATLPSIYKTVPHSK